MSTKWIFLDSVWNIKPLLTDLIENLSFSRKMLTSTKSAYELFRLHKERLHVEVLGAAEIIVTVFYYLEKC